MRSVGRAKKTIQTKWHTDAKVSTAALLLCLFSVGNAAAEIRTITATGEYRMGDNDTRTDAKRLALLDAKRLALEKAGTYIESITQIKNFDLSKEEIRAYTAGIVEVIEQSTRTIMEGETTVVRVEVTTRIDADIVARQVDALRKNAGATAELTKLREENERLQLEIQAKTRELATVRSKNDVEKATQQRQRLLNRSEVVELSTEFYRLINNDIVKAQKMAKQAVALDPTDSIAHHWLAEVLRKQGNYDAAVLEYEKALSLNPDILIAILTHFGLGDALKNKGDLDGAIEQFQQAVQLSPDAPRSHMILGNALRDKGNLDGAIAEYRTAVRLSPNLPSAHSRLAYALTRKGDMQGAIQEYRTALRLDPTDSQNYSYLAAIFRDKGDFEEAIQVLKAASPIARRGDANLMLGHIILAETLYENGRLDEAAQEYSEYLKLATDDEQSRATREHVRGRLRELKR